MGLLNSDFSREQRFLNAKKRLFSKQTQADFADNKIRFMDCDINHVAEISSAGGTYDLLLSTNKKVIGLSDFDSNKLEAGQNAAIGRIKLSYATASSTGGKSIEETVNAASFSSKIQDFPAALLRAKLVIKQDGKVLSRLPVERYTHGTTSGNVQGIEDTLKLDTPVILAAQKPVEIQLEFSPNGRMVPTADTHKLLQVRFIGTETASR